MKHRFIKTASLLLLASALPVLAAPAADGPLAWPELTSQCRPWVYWWWMGSAVDRTNLTKELTRYQAAGLGGVHIIPIYGARGFEAKYLKYLSPEWLDMMGWSVSEARRLGMGVDMTTGTGWCFGGPQVTDADANASVVVKTMTVAGGEKLKGLFHAQSIQALIAYPASGEPVALTDRISAAGQVDWTAPAGTWTVYAISQKPSGQKVKRAAPGGEGWMLNLLYPAAMADYLKPYTDAFASYTGPKPRAQYHDSYEYRSDWAPDFFAQFEKRRGYRLQDELPALFGHSTDDHATRVKCDYRETVSDLIAEESMPQWTKWAHAEGFITRYEAHGSPGNWLDLYATADIPETEFFSKHRNPLISKFASSAAHVKGGNLVAAETGTWLAEHFTETLADVKYVADDMFLSGINHIFYHGCCYSPDEAGWPGWHFYASTEMNPRNSIWHDVATVNDYVARVQSVLQSGRSDNDILVYWPILDYWSDPNIERLPQLRVEAQDWFDKQAIGTTARALWDRGYSFDYISDRQLAAATADAGGIQTGGAHYRVIVVPPCQHLPVATLKELLRLANAGATVIFEKQFPADVPGWHDVEAQRAELKSLLAKLHPPGDEAFGTSTVGQGLVLEGTLEPALGRAGVTREPLADHAGLRFVRRAFAGGKGYFIANRGDQPVDDWLALAAPAKTVVLMDALSGRTGGAATRLAADGRLEFHLQLEPGESMVVRAFTNPPEIAGHDWTYWPAAAAGRALPGDWRLEFIEGGPVLPPAVTPAKLGSWTEAGGEAVKNFAGTARYSLSFDRPEAPPGTRWILSLGEVCQSARVRLNGRDLGTLVAPPFRVEATGLQPVGNRLEVEVTSVTANRIRDLDRRGVPWKTFRDINIVDISYHPLDASDWPVRACGLLGPVTLAPVPAGP